MLTCMYMQIDVLECGCNCDKDLLCFDAQL